MTGLVCGRCRCLNLEGGPVCLACGTALAKPERTRAPIGPPQPASASALWIDDLGVARAAPRRPAVQARIVSTLDDQRARKKAARRAYVRRLMLDATAASAEAAEAARHVLVLERHGAARRDLGQLLEEFGFSVVSGACIDEVHELLVKAPPDFAAAFVGTDQEAEFAGDGIELCQFLREAGWIQDRAATAVFLLATALRPADRVRALLAGCDEVIASPPSRGAVAGALDRRGVTLPRDDRNG